MRKTALLAACGVMMAAGSAFGQDTLWGINNADDILGTFTSDDPGTFNDIGSTGISDFVNSIEFGGDGTLYASAANTLYTLDQDTGAATSVGSHNITNGETINDMAWDGSQMWGIGSICGTQSSLWTIDLDTAEATFVCTTDIDGACDVGLTVAADGTVFGHDIVIDVIYEVDPGDCTTNTVVDLPFDSNFGQGLTSSDTANYHVAFNNDDFEGQLWQFDADGNFDFLGTLEPLQVGGADVEAGDSGPCLELTIDNLVGGEEATFTVTGGAEGEQVAVLWGRGGDPSVFNEVSGWCATFGFDVELRGNRVRIVGSGVTDGGEVVINSNIPSGATGLDLLFQAAQRNTCPDECVSNLIEQVVE